MARVLVVDDSMEARLLLRTILVHAGYDVVEAENGEIALQMLRADGVDLVISDGLMPVMNGFRLCLELRQDPELASTPFIMHTASYTDPADMKLASHFGADAYLLKPSEPSLILATVEKLLTGGHSAGDMPSGDTEEFAALLGEYTNRLESKLGEKVEDLLETRRARDVSRSVLDQLPVLVATLDNTGRCDYMNRAALAFSGLQQADQPVPGFLAPAHNADAEEVVSHLRAAIEDPRPIGFDVRARRHDGALRSIRVSILPHEVPGVDRLGLLAVGLDVTEEEERRELLLYLADHDVLTDLPNRRVLDMRFAETLKRIGSDGSAALLFIDVDNLKQINDSRGHDVGDGVLMNLARLLTRTAGPDDLVVRLCGDEFVIVAENVGWDEADILAERIRSEVTSASLAPGVNAGAVTVSIGVNVVPETVTPAAALRDADAALYRAKGAGRDRTADAREPAVTGAVDELTRALEDPAPELRFAQIYSLTTGRLTRCAARPSFCVGGSVLSQSDFMSEAMRAGVARRVSDRILERTLDAMAGSTVACSVRLALPDLLDSGLFERAEAEANKRGIDPGRLFFEVDIRHALGGAPLSTWVSASERSRIRLVLDCTFADAGRPIDIDLAPFRGLEVPSSAFEMAEGPIAEEFERVVEGALARGLAICVVDVATPDALDRARLAGAQCGHGPALAGDVELLSGVLTDVPLR